MSDESFPVLPAGLQLRFWARLQLLRKEYLRESLADAVSVIRIGELDQELLAYVGDERLAALAAQSLRGESFFPVPLVLRAKPFLLGYYRLLYGLSQKSFYRGPFTRFRSLEESNRLSAAAESALPAMCRSMIETGWALFCGVQPTSLAAIHELQLLTLGPQLRGAENNVIGQGATSTIFELVRELLAPRIESSTDSVITVHNASRRVVQVSFSSDPDIAVVEVLPSGPIPTVSIEIKGGADTSNVHNRLGEAEKSHQKAKAAGFTQFWTILRSNVDAEVAKRESPTTTELFSLDELETEGSKGYLRFRDRLLQVVGI